MASLNQKTKTNHKSVTRNSFLFFIAQGLAAVFTFTSTVLIARIAGPYVTGQYSYLVWLCTTLATLAALGVPTALTKYIAEYSENGRKLIVGQLTGNLLMLSFLSSILAASILCILAYTGVLPRNISHAEYFLIALTIPVNVIGNSIISIFKGNHRFGELVKASLLSSPLVLVSVLIILRINSHLHGLITYYLISSALTSLAYAIFIIKKFNISFQRLSRKISGPVFQYIAIVSGILVLDQIVWDRSEVLFLGHYSSPQQVAIYTIPYTLINSVMMIIPGSILGSLLPHISALHGGKNNDSIALSYNISSRYIGFIVAILVGGGIALATPFIFTFYGSQYADMVPVFRILMLTEGWAVIGSITSTVIYATTKQSFIFKTGVILSIINILADLMIIPRYGAIGAALANGIAQFGGVLTGIYFLTKNGIAFPIYTYLKIIALTIVCSICTLELIKYFDTNNLVRLITGATFYLITFASAVLYLHLIELPFNFRNIFKKIV